MTCGARETEHDLTSRRRLDGALTVDLEDWRCSLNPARDADYRNRPEPNIDYLEESTRHLLQMLDDHGCKATFFVLGEVARAVPNLVKEVARRGHEIASHSPVHLPPRMIPRSVFLEMVKSDVDFLEGLVGSRPIGFRVPYLALSRYDGWLLQSLARFGFRYDSSVAPTWTPYWGLPFAPKTPYYPDISDISRGSRDGPILEIPLTVWPGWSFLPGLPIAGGFYMRAWPTGVLKWMLRQNVDSGHPLNLYIHQGNLEANKERISKPTMRDLVSQYAGADRGMKSFVQVISEFKFGTLHEIHKSRFKMGEIDSR